MQNRPVKKCGYYVRSSVKIMNEKSWTEADVIDILRNASLPPSESLGFLDDCAIIPKENDHFWLISKDCSVEGIHFLERFFSAEEIAHKVFHAAVSDIAAMGGTPKYILLGLSIAKGKPMTWVASF